MAAFYEQFAHPRGFLGALVGHWMAVKNARRSRWVLDTLALQSGEVVLEVGFGSGAVIRRAYEAVGLSGRVFGVDVSEVMTRQAAKRNRAAVREGRVVLETGSVSAFRSRVPRLTPRSR